MAPFVALVGFMGCGKTSVGSEVARLAGLPFKDMDEEFVRREGKSIPDFFAVEGESAFRRREADLLQEAVAATSPESGLVLSLGGGALGEARSRALLETQGGVVFLDVEAHEAWRRVEGSGRPLATGLEAFQDLLMQRRNAYLDVADWVIPTGGKSIEHLARDVIEFISLAGSQWPAMWGRRLASTQRSSLIVGGEGALACLRTRAADVRHRSCRLFVVSDTNVMEAWGAEVLGLLGSGDYGDALTIEPGERSKNVDSLRRIWEWLATQGARRDDVVVALGGGVVGDLAGFAASTYQRGVCLWQIPTSLLAQVDSSVGGKTAIDLEAGKNLAGAFYQPDLVVIDPRVLETLPVQEYVGGLAEVVKHALLLSEDVFARLERSVDAVVARDTRVVGGLVKMSVWYKAGVVAEDEREAGLRAVLNLGHTVGHALEVATGYGSLKHGEAVSLGLLVALSVSESVLGLDPKVSARTRCLLEALGLPTSTSVPDVEHILSAVTRDKKQRAGTTGFVGLRAIGDPVFGVNVPTDLLTQAIGVIRE